ncbi:hypothetical protein PTSG_10892 [Salpingoeca rosetta]|uniref:Uncharacterized protein n=1 Tax=Salpingoeca rosetta (strain ATCC 50818 / BSB-021) TaxID=946362 RepID=F2URB0_SALR5|nr:uncharacterized protein PTSG_10892 [Salpingoeca rosetta]EGD80213.1 hypothetical protein PTSG_10892 [Salpingoeca rosetta]|eukprot:XP_004988275.1 hypothetical protein PTSG_10892 [Salpingoeca rosetta]
MADEVPLLVVGCVLKQGQRGKPAEPLHLYDSDGALRTSLVCFWFSKDKSACQLRFLQSARTGAHLRLENDVLSARSDAAKLPIQLLQSGSYVLPGSPDMIIHPTAALNESLHHVWNNVRSLTSARHKLLGTSPEDISEGGDSLLFKMLPTPSQVADVYCRLCDQLLGTRRRQPQPIFRDARQRAMFLDEMRTLYEEAKGLVEHQLKRVACACGVEPDSVAARTHVQRTFPECFGPAVRTRLPGEDAARVSARVKMKRDFLMTFVACRLTDPPLDLDEMERKAHRGTRTRRIPWRSHGTHEIVAPRLVSHLPAEGKVEMAGPLHVWVPRHPKHDEV